MSHSQSVTAPTYTPSFDAALPPLILEACVYQDGTALTMNELSLSVENEIAWKTSTCSADGRLGSRFIRRTISGTMNPYKPSDSVSQWTNFNTNTAFSLYLRAYNPTTTSGEYEDSVAIYLPNCIITEIVTADKDGILVDNISFSADRGADGSNEEIYMGYI